MSQQPNQPTRPSNPFGSRQTVPAPAPSAPAAAQPNQPPAQPARSNPLTSRLGTPRTNWRIVSVEPYVVRFDLAGLGDPFHRLLGKKLSVEMRETEAAIRALESGDDDVQEIKERLDAAWKDYNFKGAALLYTWRKETRTVLSGRIAGTDEGEGEELYEDDKRTPPLVLRSLDLWLVLNVLARTRANILLPDAPLALEGQYLSRALFTDDPRLLALAQATGCIEELALK